jgi:predicted RNA-binding protein with PUA-like domain
LRAAGAIVGPSTAAWLGQAAFSFARAMAKRYWLMKSEPHECSIDDVLAAPARTVPWTGVRNYQARNFMRDDMRPDDGVLFYHSSCPEPGIAGIARVAGGAYPDATQFDRDSKYHDAAATAEHPRWVHVDVQAVRRVELIPLAALRAAPELADLAILRRGNRLSITPVTEAQWEFITTALAKPARRAKR